MRRPLTRFLATVAICAAALCAIPASADTDYSDAWFEGTAAGGWGVSFAQTDAVIFAKFFVYDALGNPTWFGGTLNRTSDGHYAGTLYTAVGEYFGSGTRGSGVYSAQPAGTMAFVATDAAHGALSYTVNGVAVTRLIQRQTLAAINLTGQYLGAEQFTLAGAGCGTVKTPQSNFDQFLVTQTPTSPGSPNSTLNIAIYDAEGNAVCSMRGVATQTGKVLEVANGSTDCPTGGASTAARIRDIRSAANGGLEFRWTTVVQNGCTLEGRANAMNALKAR